MRVHSIARVLERYLVKLAWEYVGDMTRDRALKLLGFLPIDAPGPEQINKAWKEKVGQPGVHPDRGGTHEKLVELNLAKDNLLGKGDRRNWVPEPTPKREPPKPKPIVDTIKGEAFEQAAAGPRRFRRSSWRGPGASSVRRSCSPSGSAPVGLA